jgi:acetyltransferase
VGAAHHTRKVVGRKDSLVLSGAELDRLNQAINPTSVAVIGATRESDRVGYSILESLLLGGFPGEVIPIHPRHEEILGLKVFPSLEEAPRKPDLAIIALNEFATIKILDDCGRHDVKGVVCVAGGYKEMGEEGENLQAELREAAVRNNILLMGPNTLGMINAQARLNATFWPLELEKYGNISVISQSGGVGQMIGFDLEKEGLTFNKWFAIGNRAMLDFDAYLQLVSQDPSTEVITVFMEGTEQARAFIEVAAGTTKNKPIIVLKAGKNEIAQQSAITHTGSMAGSYNVYNDIFDQFGLISARSVAELVSVSKALSIAQLPAKDRVAILTPTAGPSILLVDMLMDGDCKLTHFSESTMEDLAKLFTKVPVVLKNPLDASAVGYTASGYVNLAEIILKDPDVDLLLAVSIDHKNRIFPARELVELSKKYGKPIVVYFISPAETSREYREICQNGGVPFYLSAEEAAWGVAGLIRRSMILNRSQTTDE